MSACLPRENSREEGLAGFEDIDEQAEGFMCSECAGFMIVQGQAAVKFAVSS